MADLKADSKIPKCMESLIIDVRCGRRSSRQWVRKDVGRGSSSHGLYFIFRDRLKCTSDRATERLVRDRGRGDSS